MNTFCCIIFFVQLSGTVSIVSVLWANYVCGVPGSWPGGDHMSVGCGGPSLMLANLPEKHSVAYNCMSMILVGINIRNEMKIKQQETSYNLFIDDDFTFFSLSFNLTFFVITLRSVFTFSLSLMLNTVLIHRYFFGVWCFALFITAFVSTLFFFVCLNLKDASYLENTFQGIFQISYVLLYLGLIFLCFQDMQYPIVIMEVI